MAPRGQHFEAGKDNSITYCREARRDAADDSLGLLKLRMFSELSPKVGDEGTARIKLRRSGNKQEPAHQSLAKKRGRTRQPRG